MRTYLRQTAHALSALSILLGAVASAQTPKPTPQEHVEQIAPVAPQSPHDRLVVVADLSSLDVPSLKSWHMVIDVTLFDLDGKNPKTAAIETWVSGTSMKIVETLGDVSLETLRVGDQLYRSGTVFAEQPHLDLLLRELIHPVPDELMLPLVKVKQQKEKAGKESLDCLYPEIPQPKAEVVSIGRKLTYCLKQDTNTLVATLSPARTEVRQQIGTFQGKEVPVSFVSMYQTTQLATAKTAKLEAYIPQPDDFNPSTDMTLLTGPIEVSQLALVDQVLAKIPPSYPTKAKAHHVEGTLKFDAIIGTDGHITTLNPIDLPDPDLLRSAKDAVNQWIYRPYTVCGLPMQVKTVITINFNLAN